MLIVVAFLGLMILCAITSGEYPPPPPLDIPVNKIGGTVEPSTYHVKRVSL